MKFIISPVNKASVTVNKNTQSINNGLLIYMGVSREDLEFWQEKADKFINKIGRLKIIYNIETDKIDASLEDISGEILLISNFTLYGRNKKGSTLDFCHSAPFDKAKEIYNYIASKLSEKYSVKTGEFGGKMVIKSENTGPLNYILEY